MLNISHKHYKQELKFQTCCSECECAHLEKCSQNFGFVNSALALTEGAAGMHSAKFTPLYLPDCLGPALQYTALDTGHWTLLLVALKERSVSG